MSAINNPGAAGGGAGDGAILDGAQDTIRATVKNYTNAKPLTVIGVDTNGDITAFGGGTQYTNDAPLPGSGAAGVGTLLIGRAKAAAPADVSADNDAVSAWLLRNGSQAVTITAAGALIPGDATDGLTVNLGSNNDVTVTGTVTSNAGTNLNTSLLALESGGNLAGAATSLALIDDTVLTQGASAASAKGVLVLGRNSSNLATALPITSGGAVLTQSIYTASSVTAYGPLTHDSAAPDSTTQVGVLPAVASASAPTYGAGNQVLLSTDLAGALRVTGGGGGTQYTQGTAKTATDILTAAGAIRRDTAAVDTGVDDGDHVGVSTDSLGRLRVTSADTTQPVSGTVAATQSGTWTVQPGNTANTTAWKVDGSAVTQPVSGTVTAISGTAANLKAEVVGTKTNNNAAPGATNVGALTVLANASAPSWSEGNLALLSTDLAGNLRVTGGGGGTQYNQGTAKGDTDTTTLAGAVRRDSAAIDTGVADGDHIMLSTDALGRLRVTSIDVTQPVSGTVAATQSGTWTVQPGNTANTTAWKVDGSAVTQPVSGTVTAISGTAANLKAEITIASAQTLATVTTVGTVTTITNPVTSVGAAAHDVAVSGNPVLIGGEGRDTLGTGVTAGDAVRIAASRYGSPLVSAYPPTRISSNGTPITTTATTVIAAPSSGNHLRVVRFFFSNGGATATWVAIRDGAAGTRYYNVYLVQGAMVSLNLNSSGPLDLTTATRLDIFLSAAGSVEYQIDYFTVAD